MAALDLRVLMNAESTNENTMEAPKLRAAATYNAAADHFDDGPLAFWGRYGARTIDRLRLLPGSVVLDVGCGSGASAIPAAQRVGRSGRVIGVDLAERLLDLARSKARDQALDNVEFHQRDMEALDFSDAMFDAVVCVFAIFFVPDMVAQVKKLWRLVRPGGQLAITTWGPRMFEPGSSAWWAAVEQSRPELRPTVNPWERIITPEAVRQLLVDAGIQAAKVDSEEGRQALKTPDDWWNIVLGSGYRWTVDQLDAETVERVRKTNLEAIRVHRIDSVETNVVYALATKPPETLHAVGA